VPVTVDESTYYMVRRLPVVNLICSYLLWKRRGVVFSNGRELGVDSTMELRTEDSRQAIVTALINLSATQNLSGLEKNEVACRLAGLLDIDYARLLQKRILQVMGAPEIAELSRDGVDFQLHTHRHSMSKYKSLFNTQIE